MVKTRRLIRQPLYHSQKWAANMIAGLAAWNAAIADPNKRLIVQFYGDSITVGQAATDPATQGFAGLLKTYFEETYGTPHTLYRMNDPAWLLAGGTWTDHDYTFMGKGKYSSGGATATLTATADRFDLYWVNGASSNAFSVVIDGGAPTQHGNKVGTLVNEMHSFDLGTPAAEHEIIITCPAGTDRAYLGGIDARSGAGGGVSVLNFGTSGVNCPSTLIPTITGLNVLDGAALVVIEYTTNDYGNQTALATYQTRLGLQVVEAVKYASTVCLAVNWRATRLAIPQRSYDNVMKNLAITNGAGFISMRQRWGDYLAADAKGFTPNTDNIRHPNTAGHADYYAALRQFIS